FFCLLLKAFFIAGQVVTTYIGTGSARIFEVPLTVFVVSVVVFDTIKVRVNFSMLQQFAGCRIRCVFILARRAYGQSLPIAHVRNAWIVTSLARLLKAVIRHDVVLR